MRNTLILVFCLFLSATTFAQVDLKINPIGSIFGSPDLSVEFSPVEKFGVEGAFGVNFGSLNIDEVSFKRGGYTGLIAGKYYFNEEKGMDNLSVGLYVKGKHIDLTAKNAEDVDENADRNKVALGFVVGQKWVSNNNIIFSIDAGIGRNIVNKVNYENEQESSVNIGSLPLFNIDGVFRISLGYRF